MAIVFMESFDSYPSAFETTVNGWVSAINCSITTSYPRTGTRHLNIGQNQMYKTMPGGGWAELIVGYGFRLQGAGGGAGTVLMLRESTANVTHFQLKVNATGFLQAFLGNGSTQVGSTSLVPIAPSSWYWLEIRVKVHDTLGTVEVQLGGDTIIGPVSSLDTKNGGTGVIDQLYFNCPVFGNGQGVDDVIVIDPTTGTPSDFIGDSRVECIFPSGNGNSSQFLGNDGNNTDNYLLVDEQSHDSDTTYVESPTVSNKDTYAYGDIALVSGTIHALQTQVIARKSSAGSRKIVQVTRTAGGTESDSAEYNLTDSYAYNYGGIQHTKPGGGAWALADVNGAEFGVKVSS